MSKPSFVTIGTCKSDRRTGGANPTAGDAEPILVSRAVAVRSNVPEPTVSCSREKLLDSVAKYGNAAYDEPMAASRQSASQILREVRESQGRSLRVAAQDLGIAPSQLSRIERGLRKIPSDGIERVADYYGLSKDQMDLAAGRVPDDVLLMLQARPALLEEVRKLGKRT